MIVTLLLAATVTSTPALRPELAAFASIAGRCWNGPVSNDILDTHCFEPMLEGQHLRDVHEVPGTPPYRGETIYTWNDAAKRIDWNYFSSLGWMMRGIAIPVAGGIDFTDEKGDPIARWPWRAEGGYTVVNGKAPPVPFVPAQQ